MVYPKVSIIIPVYNGSDYLGEAIESALAQTYKNIEVLVVNDGSNDGGQTERIAQSYGERIRYFSKPNGGVASALNCAITEMTGDYFSWLSHDDLYRKDKIEREVSALLKSGLEKAAIYSDYSVFSTDLNKAYPVHMRGVPPEQFRYWLTTAVENGLHGCTLLIPRLAFSECGNFDETLRTTQDYDLWFRLAEKYKFIHIPELLVNARSHQQQGSIAMADIALIECNALYTKFVDNLTIDELALAKKQSLGDTYTEIGNCMRRRGFKQAEQRATELACQHFGGAAIAKDAPTIWYLIGNRLQNWTIKLARRTLSPRFRLIIRNLLQKK